MHTDPMFTEPRLRELFRSKATKRPSSKVMPIETALAKFVSAGMALHFSYAEGRPMGLSNALVRVFAGSRPGFVVSAAGLSANQAALVTEELVARLIVSFCGENYPTPAPNRVLQAALDRGDVAIENVSLLALTQRLTAGATGVPFAVTRSWQNSSLSESECFSTVADPFGDADPVGVVKALTPDIAFVHALAADDEGNLLLAPPFGEGELSAFAAKRGVIATVERIVPPEVVRRHPSLMRIPAHRVLSVSEMPFGCHPYGLFSPIPEVQGYVEDYAFFGPLRTATKDKEAFARWVADWIVGVGDQQQYLDKLGAGRVKALQDSASRSGWIDELTPEVVSGCLAPESWNTNEMMVVAAAREVASSVVDSRLPIVEAGVGFANLAAWLAVTHLRLDRQVEADLVAEIGIYGYLPRPGDPFIFSHRNLWDCKSMAGTDAILGMYVGGRHNACVAIIGAAQIDEQGNINSTYGDNDRFLVGSGGANDIASSAAEVIVVTQQSRSRLVRQLRYVTSPSARVKTVVTDRAVFRREAGGFVLTGCLPHGAQDLKSLIDAVRATCDWAFDVSPDVRVLEAPDPTELGRLRLFDVKRDFIGPL